MSNARERALWKRVQDAEDRLSAAVNKLWKMVDPNSDEMQRAKGVLAWKYDNNNPTDLEILEQVKLIREGL